MKIVIASDSYKESLSSLEVAKEIKKAFKTVYKKAQYELVCLADGGEGTVEALVKACQGQYQTVKVKDALQRKIKTRYGLIDNETTAVIEMANVVGLDMLAHNERNPLKTSTYGFGQMIHKAQKKGIQNIILGLGGSSTNDGGIGMLQAMGVRFLNKNKKVFFATVESMHKIVYIDDTLFQKQYANITFEIACDVQNPLCGKSGASYVFAEQKGATLKQQAFLDKQLSSFALVCQRHFKKQTQDIQGAGAAGGVGFALYTFLNVKMQSGIELVMQKSQLEKKLKDASLVITGEGRVDHQTAYGKTILGVATLAKKYHIPVIVIAGCIQKGYEPLYQKGVTAVFDITPMNEPQEILFSKSKENLYNCAKNIATLVNLSLKK